MNWKVEKLLNGETIISKEPGNSMTPILKSHQPVLLQPVTLENINKGDIVYCKVRGNYYTHLVKSISKDRGCLIGNNHGHNNGWTKQIYGKVIKIL